MVLVVGRLVRVKETGGNSRVLLYKDKISSEEDRVTDRLYIESESCQS